MSVHRELCETIAALELVSQVAAANPSPSGRDSSESIGGKRPSGGIDRQGDRERTWEMKSADHFRTRVRNAHSERTLLTILVEAKQSLESARRAPKPTKQLEPEYGSSQWKRYVAESTESYGTLADRFNCERSYIQQVRKQYMVAQTT